MKQPPGNFDTDRLVQVLSTKWSLEIRELEYVPVGFGAHHWRARGADQAVYFLALHDLRPPRDMAYERLSGALETAYWLRHVAELEFVLPPIRSASNTVVEPIGPDAALAVYPWLDCRPYPDPDSADLGHLLAQLHTRGIATVPSFLLRQDFAIPWRTALHEAMANLHGAWSGGPYAEATRQQLLAHYEPIRNLLAWYDSVVLDVLDSDVEWVVTHGEPRGPNLVETDAGQLLLVDWDSVLHAPRERDLWEIPESSLAFAAYTAGISAQPDHTRMRLYHAWYSLAETAIYVHQFREPHAGDLNDAEAWANFLTYLPADSD